MKIFHLFLFSVLGAPMAPATAAIIDAADNDAWSANAGWLNMAPSDGGVTVNETWLAGYAWAENIGWVKLGNDAGGPYANTNVSDWGVNKDASGNLAGYAWSPAAGWINFHPSDARVVIDIATGLFSGYAWGENIGWVRFQSPTDLYRVKVVGTNGLCGDSHDETLTAAPASDLCAFGSTNGVSGDGPWSWICEGEYDGTDASCSAEIQTYVVATAVDPVDSGSVTCDPLEIPHGGASSCYTSAAEGYAFLYFSGNCNGESCELLDVTSTPSVTAHFGQIVAGVCGASDGQTFTEAPASELCDAGGAGAVSVDATSYGWICAGDNGGADASCTATRNYQVTPSADLGGSLSPNTVQQVASGSTTSFTVTPQNGYIIETVIGCGGSLTGSSYTTAEVTGACTVSASFTAPELELTLSASSITENGGATLATVTRNGPTGESLLVAVNSSDSGEAAVPASVTIPTGATSASFTVTGQDDDLVDGKQIVTLRASAADYLDGVRNLNVLDDNVRIQSGTLSIDPSLDCVGTMLSGYTAAPLIFLGPLTSQDPDPAMAVVCENYSEGFFVTIQEWTYQDNTHGVEEAAWLTAEPGRFELADGSEWAFDAFTLSKADGVAQEFFYVPFGQTFSDIPKVILSRQTQNTPIPVTARIRNLTADGFEVSLQHEEGETRAHGAETFAYLAVYDPDGMGALPGGIDYEIFAADLDSNEQWLQAIGAAGSAAVALQEELSADSETVHAAETVSVLLLQGGNPPSAMLVQDTTVNETDTMIPRITVMDTDGDGITDGVEALYGSTPNHRDSVIDGTGAGDILTGSDGVLDIIIGGEGRDTLSGGSGADIFVILSRNDRGDTLSDFEAGLDLFDLRGLLASEGIELVTGPISDGYFAAISRRGSTYLYFYPPGERAVTLALLVGVDAGDITDLQFVW